MIREQMYLHIILKTMSLVIYLKTKGPNTKLKPVDCSVIMMNLYPFQISSVRVKVLLGND